MGVRWRLWGRTIPAPPQPAWSSSASALITGAPRAPRCRSASARFWALLAARLRLWLRNFKISHGLTRIFTDLSESKNPCGSRRGLGFDKRIIRVNPRKSVADFEVFRAGLGRTGEGIRPHVVRNGS